MVACQAEKTITLDCPQKNGGEDTTWKPGRSTKPIEMPFEYKTMSRRRKWHQRNQYAKPAAQTIVSVRGWKRTTSVYLRSQVLEPPWNVVSSLYALSCCMFSLYYLHVHIYVVHIQLMYGTRLMPWCWFSCLFADKWIDIRHAVLGHNINKLSNHSKFRVPVIYD